MRRFLVLFGAVVVGTFAIYATGFRIGGGQPTPIDNLYEEPPADALRVLFVGNSHTYNHDVPGKVQRFGEAAGAPIWVEQVVDGGASLEDQWKRETAPRRIKEGRWDFVVLQEQSLAPALDPSGFHEYVGRFADLARRSGARPVIYATWERARWNAYYAEAKQLDDPTEMRAALEKNFRKAEVDTRSAIAPVGAAWLAFRRKNPSVPLHADDGNHATVEGAYLAAGVIYRVVTGQKVAGNEAVPEAIDAEVAARLQAAADASGRRWQRRWLDEQRRERERLEEAQPEAHGDDQPPRSALEAMRQKREAEEAAAE